MGAPYDPPQLNKYTYARDNPISYIDPDGRNLAHWDCYLTAGFGGTWDDPRIVWYYRCELVDGFGGGGGLVDPPEPPEPEPPKCFAQLKYRDVEKVSFLPANHAYWWVQDRHGTQYIISGGRETDKATGKDYLRGWVTPYTGQPMGVGRDDPAVDSLWWDSGLSAEICDSVDKMLAAANAFPTRTVEYSALGPNSNSFARYIGEAGRLSRDQFGFVITSPPHAVGWYDRIPGVEDRLPIYRMAA